MSFTRRPRSHGATRVALVAAVVVLFAVFGPPLSARQYASVGAVLVVAAVLTALVAKRRADGG